MFRSKEKGTIIKENEAIGTFIVVVFILFLINFTKIKTFFLTFFVPELLLGIIAIIIIAILALFSFSRMFK